MHVGVLEGAEKKNILLGARKMLVFSTVMYFPKNVLR